MDARRPVRLVGQEQHDTNRGPVEGEAGTVGQSGPDRTTAEVNWTGLDRGSMSMAGAALVLTRRLATVQSLLRGMILRGDLT